jgi:hypothetical protein
LAPFFDVIAEAPSLAAAHVNLPRDGRSSFAPPCRHLNCPMKSPVSAYAGLSSDVSACSITTGAIE